MSQQSANSAGQKQGGGPNPYLKTKIQTASPAELRLMLLDGAVKFAELGRDGLVEKNYEKSFNNITRAEAIVNELRESLKPEVDPKLCAKLNDLYLYLYLQLVKACTERDVPTIDNVIKLLQYERETWQMVMAKVAAAPQNEAQQKVAEAMAGDRATTTTSLPDEIVGPPKNADPLNPTNAHRPTISVRG